MRQRERNRPCYAAKRRPIRLALSRSCNDGVVSSQSLHAVRIPDARCHYYGFPGILGTIVKVQRSSRAHYATIVEHGYEACCVATRFDNTFRHTTIFAKAHRRVYDARVYAQVLVARWSATRRVWC